MLKEKGKHCGKLHLHKKSKKCINQHSGITVSIKKDLCRRERINQENDAASAFFGVQTRTSDILDIQQRGISFSLFFLSFFIIIIFHNGILIPTVVL